MRYSRTATCSANVQLTQKTFFPAKPKPSRSGNTAASSRFQREHSRFDFVSPFCIVALSVIGIFFIYSAQFYVGGGQWKTQIAFAFIGAVVYLTISFTDYKIFLSYSHWLYVLAVILLLLVKVGPLGESHYGAERWLNLGFYSFQPVEIAKLSCMVTTASILARSEVGTVRDSVQVLAKMALAILVPFLLIVLQPDLGSALTIPIFVFAQLFASNLSKKFFVTGIAIFVAVVGTVVVDNLLYQKYLDERGLSPQEARGQFQEISWVPLKDYQRDRILGFLNPGKVDRKGTGWNRDQSVISVASGGAFGKGWLEGYQAQLGYLPRNVAHNDFIFSVIAEETGFLGSVVVISLFGLLLMNGIRIASVARDRFGTLLCLGVVTLFSMHIFVNIAMTIGLMPITGLPLPFLSHGGTFLVSCCVLQGLTQSVYRFRKAF